MVKFILNAFDFRKTYCRSLLGTLFLGTSLIPASAQVLVGDGSITCGESHVVESGDTLSSLSQRAYGDTELYGFIADANWDALGGNPESVTLGMSLEIPCVDATGKVLTDEQTEEQSASIEAVVNAEGVLSPEQLDTLLGPIALFPDVVLTPLLVAVTFPIDIVKAGNFIEESEGLSDKERVEQTADMPWDESVRELAAGFPDLVTRLSDNIDWTEQAGEAVVAQTDDVLASIQRLRAIAQENGYLVDNEAQTIETDGDNILIQPTDPNVVYVPTYESQVVYTTPVVGNPVYHYGYDPFYWDNWLISGGIILGGAIILDDIFDDDWNDDIDIDWNGGDIDIDIGNGNRPGIGDGDRPGIGDGGRPNIGDGDHPNIGDGDRPNIGDGDRPNIGDGERVSIGDLEGTQVDRGEIADRVGDRPSAGTRPADKTSISNTASREAARQKIQTRQASNPRPATLDAKRPSQPRATQGGGGNRVGTKPSVNKQPQNVSRPTQNRAPAARAPHSNNSSFQKQGSARPAAAANRGRASAGRSRNGGGGGRRR